MTDKAARFKKMLHSRQTEFLMEAHNGLSARIAQEAGFQGIWASGLTISAALGVRDSNEASVLEVLEFMNDAANVPIMVDADTGYGNFNNVRRLVRKLEQRGIAAMCIEDKLFPKTNSFIKSEQQPLASIDEFAGKIKAAKDTQRNPDFCVVARTEAFIVGQGLREAVERADAYRRGGADGVLIHSKAKTADQILAFMQAWGNACPVVIVPTSYYQTETRVFEDAGISMVIWANHLLRASIRVMQQTAGKLFREKSLVEIEPQIATLSEVFRIQDVEELKAAEKRYLPPPIVNGAGR